MSKCADGNAAASFDAHQSRRARSSSCQRMEPHAGESAALPAGFSTLTRHRLRRPFAIARLRELDDALAAHHLRHDADHLLRLLHPLLDVLSSFDLLRL